MAIDKSEGFTVAEPKTDTTTTSTTSTTDNAPTEESFFKKNQKVLMILAIAVVGFFAYKKFNK
jgi:hypothetical protein